MGRKAARIARVTLGTALGVLTPWFPLGVLELLADATDLVLTVRRLWRDEADDPTGGRSG